MQFITDWVMQIILFIIIATVVQMILPANSFKKYTEMVIGLFLLFIFLKPIIAFTNNGLFPSYENIEQYAMSRMPVEETINFQNNVLEKERDAYIWNEVRNTFIELANDDPSLDIFVQDIDFLTDGEILKEVIVYVKEANDNGQTSIKQIEISSQTQFENKDDKTEQYVAQLRKIWELEGVVIRIKQERGLS